MNKRVKELKEKYRLASEQAKKAAKVAEQTSLRVAATKKWAKAHSELAAGALAGIRASSLTASELKRLAPTKIDKMEKRILKLLVGWSVLDIECLLVHWVVPEAKRRATVPK